MLITRVAIRGAYLDRVGRNDRAGCVVSSGRAQKTEEEKRNSKMAVNIMSQIDRVCDRTDAFVNVNETTVNLRRPRAPHHTPHPPNLPRLLSGLS